MTELREVVKHHGGRMFVAQVKFIDLFKIDVGEYVTIDNEEGLIIPEVFDVLDCTSGTKNRRLVASCDRDVGGLVFDKLVYHIG